MFHSLWQLESKFCCITSHMYKNLAEWCIFSFLRNHYASNDYNTSLDKHEANHTCTTTSFPEAQFRMWSPSSIRISAPVSPLISESTSPSLPPKQPTESDATRSFAVTDLP